MSFFASKIRFKQQLGLLRFNTMELFASKVIIRNSILWNLLVPVKNLSLITAVDQTGGYIIINKLDSLRPAGLKDKTLLTLVLKSNGTPLYFVNSRSILFFCSFL